jgi:hypothetical protein
MAKAFQVTAVGPPQAARDAKSCSVGRDKQRDLRDLISA